MSTHPVIDRIARAIEFGQGANRGTAATLLGEMWEEVGPAGNAVHRCGIAHALADLQTQPEDELFWDLQALHEADRATDEHTEVAGMMSGVGGSYPSLHLNLADVYRRLGRTDGARKHVDAGMSRVESLEDDGYGNLIRSGLERIAAQLGQDSEA